LERNLRPVVFETRQQKVEVFWQSMRQRSASFDASLQALPFIPANQPIDGDCSPGLKIV
jgi:hypothetical protein